MLSLEYLKYSYFLDYCLFADGYKIQSSCPSTLDGHSQLSSGHIHLDVSQPSQISLSKRVSTICCMISRQSHSANEPVSVLSKMKIENLQEADLIMVRRGSHK